MDKAREETKLIYMHLTDALGPLPYTEAFQAGEENFTPVFLFALKQPDQLRSG